MEKVSVCLTLYNEGRGIQRVLDYLDINEKIISDVVIVSDACKDGTDQIVQTWMQNTQSTFRVCFIKRAFRHGRANAVRKCLEHTTKDLNVFIAGDILPLPNALSNIIHYFRDSSVGGVTGHPILLNGLTTLSDHLSHLMWTSHDKVGKIQTRKGKFFHLNGEVFAIRKHCLGGFKRYDGIAEDAMMGALIRLNGYKVLWAENVLYYMQYPSKLSEWVKVRKRCCFGRIDLWHRCQIQDYPFYEISHPEYLLNVIKSTHKSVKGFFALAFGAFLELTLRLYYKQTYHVGRDLLTELWEPVEGTKW